LATLPSDLVAISAEGKTTALLFGPPEQQRESTLADACQHARKVIESNRLTPDDRTSLPRRRNPNILRQLQILEHALEEKQPDEVLKGVHAVADATSPLDTVFLRLTRLHWVTDPCRVLFPPPGKGSR
jgi:hypothetical protein